MNARFFPAVFPSSGEGGISRWEHGLRTTYSTLFPCRLLSRNLASFQETTSATVPENLYRQFCAPFLVWFSAGSVWHRAQLDIQLHLGLYYFILISLGMVLEPEINKIKNSLNIKKESKLYKAFQIFRTFVLVNFGMLIFRADNLQVCINMFTKLFTDFNPAQVLSFFSINLKVDINDIFILIISCTVLLTMEILRERGLDIRKLSEKPTAAR